MQQLPDQQTKERLLGIFDIRWKEAAQINIEALFRYEVVTLRQQMGGGLIIDATDYREEWREITKHGCFPTLQQKYKVT